MNRILRILFIFIVIFLFDKTVYANENSNDVKAKYDQNINEFYSGIIAENKVEINTDKISFIINSTDQDNGIEVIIIPVYDDALEWLKKAQEKNFSNIISYYVKFRRNNKEIIPKGKIEIKSAILDDYDKISMGYVNLDGKLIAFSNKLENDTIDITISEKGYIIYGEQINDNIVLEESPKTFDGIKKYFIIEILSIIGLLVIILYLNEYKQHA